MKKKKTGTKKNIKLTPHEAEVLFKLEFLDYKNKERDVLQFIFKPQPINQGSFSLEKNRSKN